MELALGGRPLSAGKITMSSLFFKSSRAFRREVWMEEVWHSSGHLLSLNVPYPHLIPSNLVAHPLQPTNLPLFPPREWLPTVLRTVWYERRGHMWRRSSSRMAIQSASSCSPSRKEKDDPRSRVTIPYIQGVSEAVTRILSDINVQVHMKPFRTPSSSYSWWWQVQRCVQDQLSWLWCQLCRWNGEGTQDPCVGAPQGNGEDGLLCFCSSAACMGARPSHRLD